MPLRPIRRILWGLLWIMLAIPSAAAPAPPANPPATGLQLLVLGSGGPGAEGRASSSYLLSIDGTARILVDAGPGPSFGWARHEWISRISR